MQELASRPRTVTSRALASVNTLNDQVAIRSLLEINEAQTKDLETLAKEPAIARIAVKHDDGRRAIYFISRAGPLGHTRQGAQLASYRSPPGRLASLPVGSVFTHRRPAGTVDLEIVGRALLRPHQDRDDW